MPKELSKKELEKLLSDFIKELEEKGLMHNAYFNYKKIIKKFIVSWISKPSTEYIEKHLD